MTDEQAITIYREMEKMFGDKLPNPEHYPREFAYYFRLYLHSKKYGY